jgi:3-hydroxyisobutyrate dehydrogenase-like beta-hydroxyacid dehydrogenase
MGSQLAANLVEMDFDVVTHDLAGDVHNPAGAVFLAELSDLAHYADIVVLSLPDGLASENVVGQLIATPTQQNRFILDTSTIGPAAAQSLGVLCAQAGVGYVDAPVSGGATGARARTLMVMYAGSDGACAGVEPVLLGLSDRRCRVGDIPGLAQAMKLANNFLVATIMGATSEAVAFALKSGLEMRTMLEVLNVSSGQSAVSTDKFVNHVMTGTYSSGFMNTLMSKDVQLYLEAVEDLNGPESFGVLAASLWKRFAQDEPGVDFTRIYQFVSGQ